MKAFEGGPDWRGPIADRALISSADAGYSINNAARITYDLVNKGRELAGQKPLAPPKDGAQFHFTLPGSVQGFEAARSQTAANLVNVRQDVDDHTGSTGLAIKLKYLSKANGPVEVLTPTFTPPEITKMKTYDLMASPLLYPGQTLKALVRASKDSTGPIDVYFRCKVYGKDDELQTLDSDAFVTLTPGSEKVLEYLIPDNMDSQPIQKVGIALLVREGNLTGTVWLDYLRWDGTPQLTLRRPKQTPCDFWRQAWVNAVSKFHQWGPSFFLAQDAGGGIISYGTREWKDYQVTVSNFKVNLGGSAGVAVRVQGLKRWYALLLMPGNRAALVKAHDEMREELHSAYYEWTIDSTYQIAISVKRDLIKAQIDGEEICKAKDSQYREGGIGLILNEGSIAAEEVKVGPVEGRSGFEFNHVFSRS